MKLFDQLTSLEWWVNRLGWIWHNIIKWILLGLVAIAAFLILNVIGVIIVGIINQRYRVKNGIWWFLRCFIKLPFQDFRSGRADRKYKERKKEEIEKYGTDKHLPT